MRSSKRTKPGDCPAGLQWYVCHANNFVGCCSVDPCDLESCPDTSSSSSSLITSSILQTSALTVSSSSSTLSPISSTSSPAPSTSIPQASSTLLGAGPPGSSTILTSSTTGLATSSPTGAVSTNSSSSKSSTPIIAGVVPGVVFLFIMALSLWFCVRRRKQATEKTPKSISQYGVPDHGFVLSRPMISEPRLQEEVFAPFGGAYRSKNYSRSEEYQQLPAILPTSPPPTASHVEKPQARRPSHTQTSSQATLRSHASSEHAQAQAEAISACAPELPSTPPRDPEKAALTPPPEHEHPIYGIPSFTAHPGTPVDPNLEPIRGIDFSLQNNLPVFRPNPTKSHGGREHKYKSLLRRTSEVRGRPNTSLSLSRRQQQDGWGNSPYTSSDNMGPSPATTLNSPVPPGVSELDGQEIHTPLIKTPERPVAIIPDIIELEAGAVPERYLSPPFPMPSKDVHKVRDSVTIPVGLGVGVGIDPTTPTSMYPQTPENETFPATVATDIPQVPSLKSRFNQSQAPAPADSVYKAPNLFMATREVLDGSGKEVVSPLSPEMQRWSGITAIGSRGGTPADMNDIVKRRREELVPLSGMSVDVEREWGSWALR